MVAMRKTILRVLGATVVIASLMQPSVAAEHHHVRYADPAPVPPVISPTMPTTRWLSLPWRNRISNIGRVSGARQEERQLCVLEATDLVKANLARAWMNLCIIMGA